MAYKEQAVVQFLLEELERHKSLAGSTPRPLIVGLQGPQGSGKSYTCASVASTLAANQPPVNLTLDLYLPHDALMAVGRDNPSNNLLQGRGQPGTHDVELGTSLLHAIRKLNDQIHGTLELPVYDKSAWGGQGDRAAKKIEVQAPVDILLFEGWCLGFGSLDRSTLQKRMDGADKVHPPVFSSFSLEHLEAISEHLRVWEHEWYPLIDAFVQFCPYVDNGTSPWSLVYPWRLQAEHTMKMANEGHGMTDEQVAKFVHRYVPAKHKIKRDSNTHSYLPSYELFYYDLRKTTPWKTHTLCLDVDQDREAIQTQQV